MDFPTPPVLQADCISKHYAEIEALRGVSLSLLRGEVHGVLGVDGAGKSTLIKVLSGVEAPDAGRILIDGLPLPAGSPDAVARLAIGVVHQYVRLVPNMSLVENIMLAYAPKKRFLFLPVIDWRKVRQAAQEAMQLLECDDIDLDRDAGQLTFAQQQMAKMAKALAIRPRILLLDEPTYGLSEAQANVLFRAMRSLVNQGACILYASQRVDIIPRIADRVSVLKEGKILGTMQAGEVDLRSVVELMVAETSQAMALREADRLRHEFVSLVSHELRTPLATIRGYAETVTSRDWSDEIRQECLDNISSGCERLTELVDSLLDMSSLERGSLRIEPEPVALPGLTHNLLRAQWSRKTAGRSILLRFPPDFPTVQADPKRIEQVLSNLIDNALKYSPADSPITISGALQPGGRMVTVTVEDQGAGIPPEHQERVFERFYRVPNPGTAGVEGSGLGLAICKGIIERHGGRLWLHSLPGEGSAFSFSLPVIPAEVAPNGEVAP